MKKENILEVQGLTVTYRRRFFRPAVTILQDVNMEIPRGHIVVILGGNGTGKSTLMKTLVTSTENDFDRRTLRTGEILFRDRNLLTEHSALQEFRPLCSYSKQCDSVDDFEPAETVRGLLMKRVSADHTEAEAEKMATEMLSRFHATHIADKTVRELSGGQMRLLMIMECLIYDKAELYLIDEPYNDLDDERARCFSNYLAEMHEKRPDASFIVITHCKKILRTDDCVSAYRIEGGHLTPCEYHHVLCLGELNEAGTRYAE